MDYDSESYQPMIIGDATYMMYKPAEYIIYLEYDGVRFRIDDKEIYNYVKDKIGKKLFVTYN